MKQKKDLELLTHHKCKVLKGIQEWINLMMRTIKATTKCNNNKKTSKLRIRNKMKPKYNKMLVNKKIINNKMKLIKIPGKVKNKNDDVSIVYLDNLV